MTLSLRAMRYVQAALRAGNISTAAEAMNVAPSAIAAALAQAEDTFGISLATRARAKGIFPTATGREVQRRIDDLLERYDGLLTDMSDLRNGVSGTLKIGYNAPIAPAFLASIAAQIVKSHPEVTLYFSEENNTSARSGLIEGQLDVILFVEEIPTPQIATRPLIFAPTFCICSKDHRLSQSPALTISEIAREPLILLDRPAARSYYMELLSQAEAPFKIVATANSTEMVRSLVSTGLGVSLVNMRPRDIPPYTGDHVRCIPLVGATNGVQFSLGFAPGPIRFLTQLFIDACSTFFDGPQGSDFIVAFPADR